MGTHSDFMQLWTQGDAEMESIMGVALLDSLDAAVQAKSDVLAGLARGRPVSGPVVRWMEEWAYPSAVTARLNGNSMTFSAQIFGRAVDGDSIRMVIREGTILERPTDGLQVRVLCLDGLSASVTAYGNTNLADDPGPTAWDIISEAWSDYRDASGPRSLARITREAGTQIFTETFEIPKTRKNTRYRLVANEAEHQIAALLGKLRRQLAHAVLRSRPCHDGSAFIWGDKTDEPTMCGLCTWPVVTQSEQPNPNVYVNKGGQALSKADLDSLVRQFWLDEHADYHKGDWWIVCHPWTHQFIQDFDISYRRTGRQDRGIGFRVDEFHSKLGKSFSILSEPYLRSDVLLVVNFDAFTYGYYRGDTLEREEIPTQGRYQRWLISFQTYGVVARNPRANIGMIYGLPGE